MEGFAVVTGDQAGFVDECCARYRDFEEGAVCDGVEKAEEGEFGGGEAGSEGVGADLGNVQGGAGEGC